MISRRFFTLSLSALTLLLSSAAAQSTGTERVIIRTAKPYNKTVAAIQARGGSVTRQYQYIDAIAATVPQSAVTSLGTIAGITSITKDVDIRVPDSIDVTTLKGYGAPASAELAADSINTLAADDIAAMASTPSAYSVNNTLMGLDPLHAAGLQGNGVVVAVIDSGIRPGFPHIAGSVIGGEDFVGDGMGFSNFANNGHGTFVSGMITAHVVFGFSNSNILVKALNAYAPGAATPVSPTVSAVPMVGTAPKASIYALRVFGPSGSGPSSAVMAAVERAIELREMYNAGTAGGLNIRICNMSLGGPSVDPGLDPLDQVIDALLAHDIVPVVAAGNAGPAAMTLGSPSSSASALSVGAANLAHNERVLRDLQFGFGVGALYRPFSGTEMAYFSSRGPDPDGRVQPNVVANGFANFGMGLGTTTSSISIGSGTSFATPSVAGIAAVLRQAFPNAAAAQIRNAIIVSANPASVTAAINLDQGAGYVNATSARAVLTAGSAPNTVPQLGKANSSVKVNVEKGTSLNVLDGNVTQAVANLQPGERRDLVYRISPNTSQIIVSLSGFTAALPAAQQNALFGDDLLVAVHSAKTSSIGEGDYKAFSFIKNGSAVINSPETGLLRVSISGDWTNAGSVSTTASIVSLTDPIPQFTAQDKIVTSQAVAVPFTVPAGTQLLEGRLAWRNDWGTFPTADIDLILISPTSKLNFDGATLNNPELAAIKTPETGNWIAIVNGFDIPGGSDKFELRVALDGKVIH